MSLRKLAICAESMERSTRWGRRDRSSIARLALTGLLLDRRVVGHAVRDRVGENRGVRCQTRHREVGDVACERPVLQEVAGNVVEPETLALVVKRLGGFHVVVSGDIARDAEG